MAYILAKQKPNWEPGTKSGYHAITYGWIVDQIVRRADPQGRSVGQFFKEEVADKYGEVLIVLGIFHLRMPNSIARKVRDNPQWFRLEQDVNTFNDPELHAMEQVAALGITKARDLARLFSLMLEGKFFSKVIWFLILLQLYR
ncbi:unnamed protein product [Cylicostephanus goldi]|uniref:Beta-lactamase-related domain-containing protein n=1 Tax=Cylicostephanus goldi TaxID=71465 RepID=A0A3P7QSH5_CYLGO|nr:unnamed protein product [Cylicostephanus goldi]